MTPFLLLNIGFISVAFCFRVGNFSARTPSTISGSEYTRLKILFGRIL